MEMLKNLNYLAITVSAVVYFVLGSIWSGSPFTAVSLLQEQVNRSKAQKGFIYCEGNKLMFNGKKYQSASFNSFQLSGCGHDNEVFTDAQVDALFASLPDNIMIRTWAFPGNTAKIDRVIKAAEEHDVKLILTLADGRSHCGHTDGAKGGDGSGKRPDWYTNGFRKQYLPHVTQMTTTYKNSPAIGMWEIINEPGDADWQAIKQFFDIVAAEMKKNDPNHLVSTGSWAPWAYDGDANFQTLHESPNIDVGSVHEYDYDYENSNTIESPHFAGALRAMNNLNKVLIVGETGIDSGDSCRTNRQTRADAMKQKFDVYLSKGAGAVLVWNLAQSSTGCGTTFPVTDPLLDMIKTYPVNVDAANPGTGGTLQSTSQSTVPANPKTAPVNPVGIIFRGDFETGNLSQWDNTQACPSGVTIVTSPVRKGKYAAKFTVNDGDTNNKCDDVPTGDPRAQLVSKPLFKDGDEAYIGFSVFFPADFPTPRDWFQIAEIYGPPFGGSPSMGIDMKGNRIGFSRDKTHGYDTPWEMKRDVAKGRAWEDMVLHIKFSPNPDIGFVEIWHNGMKQTFKNGSKKLNYATLAKGINWNPGGSNSMFINQYRSKEGKLGTVTIYHDEVLVGKTYGSVAR